MKTVLYSFVTVFILLQLGMTNVGQDFTEEQIKGKSIYENNCLRCHGANGKGNGPDASTLTVPPANFQSPESRAKSELDLRSAVVWGLAFSPMHKWFDKLTPQEMREVVQYIRQIAPFRARLD